jgi:4-hydroxybenzoate polyprenyltransferase
MIGNLESRRDVMGETETAATRRAGPFLSLPRLLSCIRFDEALVLQGAPLVGAVLSVGAVRMGALLKAGVLAAGSLCLVAHVFVLNDWSGIGGDLNDPNRARRTFAAKGVSRAEVGVLTIVLLILGLLLLAPLGRTTLAIALAIGGLSVLYSVPALHVKGLPIINSGVHLVGGALLFLLGYTAFASAVDARGLAISAYTALVFTAGHLTHEVRDCEGDLLNGVRTNAVAFGKRQSFVAGLVLFTGAYALLVALAAFGAVPRLLVLTAVLYPAHLLASWQALRAGLNFDSLRRLQACYRLLHLVIGIMIVVAALWLNGAR